MIKLKPLLEYRSEDDYNSKPMTIDAIVDQFKTGKFDMNQYLYKGMTLNEQYYYSKPTLRSSRNTTNYYTNIMSYHPMWNEYPKRNMSAICTDARSLASQYNNGDVFYIFPEKDTMTGVCPALDIWLSFNKITTDTDRNMRGFNDILGKMLFDYNYKEDYSLNKNGLKLLEVLKKLNKDTMKFEMYNMFLKYNDKENMYDYITEYMSPEYNDFKKLPIGEIQLRTEGQGLELWFSSDCLIVYEGRYQDIKQKLGI